MVWCVRTIGVSYYSSYLVSISEAGREVDVNSHVRLEHIPSGKHRPLKSSVPMLGLSLAEVFTLKKYHTSHQITTVVTLHLQVRMLLEP